MNAKHKPVIYLALLHYPVYNKKGDVVTTAVTNIDVHDILRSSRTYGVQGVYFVTPIEQQQVLVEEIIQHWRTGWGATHNPARSEAFSIARVSGSLEATVDDIALAHGLRPECIVTSAKVMQNTISYTACRERLRVGDGKPQLLLFGTGWGMTDEVVEKAEFRLPPLEPASWAVGSKERYNHLSVRSAVATILDRLMGNREE